MLISFAYGQLPTLMESHRNLVFADGINGAKLFQLFAGLKQKYDADIALLKEAMLDLQQLVKNPEKLAEMSRTAKPEISL